MAHHFSVSILYLKFSGYVSTQNFSLSLDPPHFFRRKVGGLSCPDSFANGRGPYPKVSHSFGVYPPGNESISHPYHKYGSIYL